jgi:hypothetical protein
LPRAERPFFFTEKNYSRYLLRVSGKINWKIIRDGEKVLK